MSEEPETRMKELAKHAKQGAGEWIEHKKTWPPIAAAGKRESVLFLLLVRER